MNLSKKKKFSLKKKKKKIYMKTSTPFTLQYTHLMYKHLALTWKPCHCQIYHRPIQGHILQPTFSVPMQKLNQQPNLK